MIKKAFFLFVIAVMSSGYVMATQPSDKTAIPLWQKVVGSVVAGVAGIVIVKYFYTLYTRKVLTSELLVQEINMLCVLDDQVTVGDIDAEMYEYQRQQILNQYSEQDRRRIEIGYRKEKLKNS